MKKIFKINLVILIALVVSACSDSFFDINDNPNQITNPTPDLTLRAAEIDMAYFLQDDYNTAASFWVNYYTRAGNIAGFDNRDQYDLQPGDNTYQRDWQGMYTGPLTDLKITGENALALGDEQTWAVSELLSAYAFQVMVDMFDTTPYTEALQGKDNTAPVYDDGAFIYGELITRIDAAMAVIDATASIGDADLIFQGDMSMWEKFGNTLKLRIYMRQSEVNSAAASAGIGALAGPFLGAGEDAKISFDQSNPANRHPFDIADLSKQTFVAASATMVNFLAANNDPRLDVYYRAPAVAASDNPDQDQRGVIQGRGTDLVGTEAGLDFWSAPGDYLIGAGSAAAFFSGTESMFLQAEAALRGYTTGDAQLLYENAVRESFANTGVGGSAGAYLAAAGAYPAGTFDQNLEKLMVEKWVALCGRQGLEMFAEWRRTGYPGQDDNGTPTNANDDPPGYINPSTISTLPDPTAFPGRFPYIQREVDFNSNAPAFVSIDSKVWWDVN